MGDPALLTLDRDRLRRLSRLLRQEGGEGDLLQEVLELWAAAVGVGALAAYLPGEAGYERVALAGSLGAPALLESVDAAALPARRYGEAVLLSDRPVSGSDPEEPLPLLLTAALLLWSYRTRLKRQEFDTRLRGVELEALYEVGLAIASPLDVRSLTEEILLRAVSQIDARRGALYLLEGDVFQLQNTIGGGARKCFPGGTDPEERGLDPLPGARHLLAVPILVDGAPRGQLVVGDKESRVGVGPFTASDRRSLAAFANQVALAVEQARLHREAMEKERMEREMELASQIQRDILPKAVPELTGYELVGWTRPARHVGGDFYDLVPLADQRLALVVADVSGKGVPAALLVSTLHALLRILLDRSIGLEELCRDLNDHLLRFSASNKFVTLFLAELDPPSGRLRYVNAGHNAVLLVRASGEIEELPARSVPLGLLAGPSFQQEVTSLEMRDVLCLYSDGVTEAESSLGEELGLPRLKELLAAHRTVALEDLRGILDGAVAEFTRGVPQGDDQTVVMVRRLVAATS